MPSDGAGDDPEPLSLIASPLAANPQAPVFLIFFTAYFSTNPR